MLIYGIYSRLFCLWIVLNIYLYLNIIKFITSLLKHCQIYHILLEMEIVVSLSYFNTLILSGWTTLDTAWLNHSGLSGTLLKKDNSIFMFVVKMIFSFFLNCKYCLVIKSHKITIKLISCRNKFSLLTVLNCTQQH